MSFVSSLKDALRQSPSTTQDGEQSNGSYWCTDCSERIRDVDYDGDDAPSCPECGDEMEFERSPDSAGCAC